MKAKKATVLFFLLLNAAVLSAQETGTLERENRYLRKQVDSLERVIRTMKRRTQSTGTVSSLQGRESENASTWSSRTGYYDRLGDIDSDRPLDFGTGSGRYSDVNFIGFPYEWLIDRMVTTCSEAQTTHWAGILGRWFKYKDSIESYFTAKGLPRELAMLCVIESGCSAKALSRAGAAGFWQFMPETGRDLGLRIDELVDERLDVDRSTWAATKFINHAYRILGSWDATVAAYNWGTGNIQNARRNYGENIEDWYDHLPDETQSYLPALIAALWLADHYDETDIDPSPYRETIVAKRVEVGMSFKEIAEVTGIPIEEITRQNPQYLTGFIPGNQGVYYVKASSRFKNNLNKL